MSKCFFRVGQDGGRQRSGSSAIEPSLLAGKMACAQVAARLCRRLVPLPLPPFACPSPSRSLLQTTSTPHKLLSFTRTFAKAAKSMELYKVFFDMAADGHYVGRIVMEVFISLLHLQKPSCGIHENVTPSSARHCIPINNSLFAISFSS